MKHNTTGLGQWGEAQVAAYLKQKGYAILRQNYRCRLGEIDIIAQNDVYLLFVEVKLRKDTRFGYPREFVDRRKQEKILLAAQTYMLEEPSDRQPRFDVAEVYAPQGVSTNFPEIEYIEHAF